MNAEQKDFLKYGEALGILKERKSLMRSNSCTRCKRNPDNKAFNNLPDYWMKGDFE